MGLSISKVVVPVAYDLGGTAQNVEALKGAANGVVGDLEVDRPALRAFNLAFLSTHPPILSASLEPSMGRLDGVDWSIQRTLRIFPRLGLVLHTLEFKPDRPVSLASSAGFYDAFLEWEHLDYFQYLDRMGAMSETMVARTRFNRNLRGHGTLTWPVEDLRLALSPVLQARAVVYPFQDFRVIYVVSGESRSKTREIAIAFQPLGLDLALDDEAWFISKSIDVLATPTVSVAIEHAAPGSQNPGPLNLDSALTMFAIAHAQWYLCQIWIHNADQAAEDWANQNLAARIVELSEMKYHLGRDLAEVGNPDTMLNDAQSIRLASYWMNRIGLERQHQCAKDRLKVLSDYFSVATSYQATRDAQRLQILFSFSAAASIAALVPTLAVSDLTIRVATSSLAVLAWLAFVINFGRILRRGRSGLLTPGRALDPELRNRAIAHRNAAQHSISARTADRR